LKASLSISFLEKRKSKVQRFRVRADRLGSWKAIKLEGQKARRLGSWKKEFGTQTRPPRLACMAGRLAQIHTDKKI
jgi:hypothetical protein